MKPDEPRLASIDLRRTFGVDPDGAWPRPGDVTAIIGDRRIARPSVPTAPSIRAIVLNPARYVNQKVTVSGQFTGRNLIGDLPDAPGRSRCDFVIRSADAAIWVSGARPKGKGFDLALDARHRHGPLARDHRRRAAGRGLQWLERPATAFSWARRRPKRRRRREPIGCPQRRRPEVVFSAPTQDETDVSLSTIVRIQFSRDLNQSTLKGHVTRAAISSRRRSSAVSRTRRRRSSRRSTTPSNRVLELKFAKPLERFRTMRSS